MVKHLASRIFRLVYEDERIIVIDKNAGFLTVPTERRESNTVVTALTEYLRRRGHRRAAAYVVHRLDRDTSGLLVWAKDRTSAETLMRGFAVLKTEREYLAIVSGHLRSKEGRFESYLKTDRALNQRSVHGRGVADAQLAVTHFKVARVLQNATAVRVTLETGRRNQIRVHFAEAGHPILGDRRYGSEAAMVANWDPRRLALHAASLAFEHPGSGEVMRFESPPPQPFQRFIF